MIHRTPLTAFALAACAFSAQAADNHIVASLKWQNITASAYDLDPSDGLSPSFTTLNQPDAITQLSLAWLPNQPTTQTTSGQFGSLSVFESNGDAKARGTVSQQDLDLSITVDGAHPFANLFAGSSNGLDNSNAVNFRLAPGSGLRISGALELMAQADCPGFCQAVVSISGALFDPLSPASAEGYARKGIQIFGTDKAVLATPFEFSYGNRTDQAMDLTFWYSGNVMSASAVPEPANAALLLAGLATVAAVRRKRT